MGLLFLVEGTFTNVLVLRTLSTSTRIWFIIFSSVLFGRVYFEIKGAIFNVYQTIHQPIMYIFI